MIWIKRFFICLIKGHKLNIIHITKASVTIFLRVVCRWIMIWKSFETQRSILVLKAHKHTLWLLDTHKSHHSVLLDLKMYVAVALFCNKRKWRETPEICLFLPVPNSAQHTVVYFSTIDIVWNMLTLIIESLNTIKKNVEWNFTKIKFR